MITEKVFENFTWIDICEPEKIGFDKIAETHQLDLFQVKDSMERGHLPKFEKHENYTFLILRAFSAIKNARATNINDLSNKIAFFYAENKIITIHRSNFDFLTNLPSSFSKPEQLLLHILNLMVESYRSPAQSLSNKIDTLEKTIFLKTKNRVSLEEIYFKKTQTRLTKKLLIITQNTINQIAVDEESKTALQDIKDKLLDLILTYEEILENTTNLLNAYLSLNAQKSNRVMEVLTVFSAFFLPLTFIVGVYGMNFENMPELKHPYGYYSVLGLMLGICLLIYYWFKRKKIL